MRRTTGVMTVVMLGALMALSAAPRAQSKADVALRAAIETETVAGNLKAAIEQYKVLAAGSDRAIAAKALVAMGRCYDKLGAAQAKEAQKAYERVLAQFPDQADAATEARARLAERRAEAAPAGASEQLVLAGAGEVIDVSRDGRFLIVRESATIVGPWSLRNRQTGEAVRIHLDPDGFAPVLSPDLRRVAYSRFDGNGGWQVKVSGLDGSLGRVLAEGHGVPAISIKDWSPDGTRLLVTDRAAESPFPLDLAVMSVADGAIRRLGVRVGGRTSWSPDGRYILYVDRETLFVMTPDGTSRVPVIEPQQRSPLRPLWTADGRHILYTSDRAGAIDLLEVEILNGKAAGAPKLVKADVGEMAPMRATPDGTLFWRKSVDRHDVYTVDLDHATGRASAPVGLHARRGALGGGPVAWAPDGNSLAFIRRVVGATDRIVIRSLSTGEDRDVPGDHPLPYDLHWLPDGNLLTTSYGRSPQIRVDTIDPTTGQQKTVIPALPRGAWRSVAVSPDGRSIYYSVAVGEMGHPSINLRLMRHDLGATEGKELYRVDSAGTGFFSLSASPDGRQLSFGLFPDAKDVKTTATVTCPLGTLTLDGAVVRTLAPTLGNGHVAGTAWTPDSRSVIAVNSPVAGASSDILLFPVGGGEPRALGLNAPDINFMTASRDGRHLAFVSGESKEEMWMTRNLLSKAPAAPGVPRPSSSSRAARASTGTR